MRLYFSVLLAGKLALVLLLLLWPAPNKTHALLLEIGLTALFLIWERMLAQPERKVTRGIMSLLTALVVLLLVFRSA